MLPIPLDSVVFQPMDDGAVLFFPSTEVYFGLNKVGARVWQLLPPECRSMEDLCDRLAAEYPDADPAMVRADVSELLEQLSLEGLVRAPDATSGSDAGAS